MNANGQKENNVEKRTFQKSRPYPFYDINVALQLATTVEKLGTKNVSEPILLKELGIKTPYTRSFASKVSSAKYFGLILVDGKTYTLTERAKLILRPKDDYSKKNLLIECFLLPELYKELYEKFREKQIPPVDTLANILLHDHNINPNVSRDAAMAFIDSAKYVGLLESDNVLKGSTERNETAPIVEHKDIDTLKQTPVQQISDTFTVPMELSNGIMAGIIVPRKGGIPKKDSERFHRLIDIYVIEEGADE